MCFLLWVELIQMYKQVAVLFAMESFWYLTEKKNSQ